ncbi:MAG: carbohydrate kinase, partial [Saprospiraceae bacterium]|nr:carbohydrate kinase [Saprospiraceae bacterium]
MLLLGYDIGSSTIKASIYQSDRQRVIALTQYPDQEMDIISRQSGWAEQQPVIWWENLCMATKYL